MTSSFGRLLQINFEMPTDVKRQGYSFAAFVTLDGRRKLYCFRKEKAIHR